MNAVSHRWWVLALVGLALGAGEARAGIDGISYTLQPSYSFLKWDSAVPLKDTEMYGGRVGINFGRYVSLTPYFMMRGNARTDFAGTGLKDGALAVPEGRVDLRNYGANVVLSTGGSNVAPFLRGGAGVMEFKPDQGGPRSRQINVNAGGGVRFGINRLRLELYAEDTAFRLDRYRLAAGNTRIDPEADRIRHNLAFGGSVNLNLGGHDDDQLSVTDRAVAERYRNGLRGLSLPMEVFVGRLDFPASQDLDHQNLAGLRTGLDFGPYFGLRAFYWRAMNDSFDDTARLQSYGGEARFNLASGQGVIPYLVLGAGQLDFMTGYHDRSDSTRADKSVLILGGGLALGIGDRLRLNVGARDNLMSARDLTDLAAADELRSNWSFTAGLGFNLFGGGQQDEAAARDTDKVRRRDDEMANARTRDDDRDTEMEKPRSRDDRRDYHGRDERGDRKWSADRYEAGDRRHGRDGDDDSLAVRGRMRMERQPNYAGERMVTFPVPREGEIYVRYGPNPVRETGPSAGAADVRRVPSEESIRQAIREELGQLNAPGGAGAGSLNDPQQMELMERRILDRLNQAREAAAAATPPPAAPPAATPPAPREERPVTPAWPATPATPAADATPREPGTSVQGLRLYVGDNISAPTQLVAGLRARLGTPGSDSQVSFVPELAVGNAKGKSSFMVAGNLQVDLKRPDAVSKFGYYTYGGLGFLHTSADDARLDHSGLVFNLGVGAEYLLVPAVPFFVELQGVDLFDQTRLLLGLRYRK